MGIILAGVMLLYFLFAVTIVIITWKTAKSKIVVWVIGTILVLFPFKHTIFFSALFKYYALQPLQEVDKKVEYPLSVYWEDEVWPGFDAYGRNWMVENYLDGIHLQVLALNGDDGKIYLYRATEKSRVGSTFYKKKVEKLEKRDEELRLKSNAYFKEHGKRDPRFLETRKTEVRPLLTKARSEEERLTEDEVAKIIEKVEVYTSASNLPSIHYHVKLEPIHRFFPANKLYHADLITITDISADKVIAWSKRFMAYAPWIYQISGKQPEFGMKKGDIQVYEFDDKVLFEYARIKDALEVTKDNLDRAFYKLGQ